MSAKAARWLRATSIVLTALLVLAGSWMLLRWWTEAVPAYRALDIGHYLDATRRWLATGTPYLAHEVAGPYPSYSPLTFLHPPISLYLFWVFLYVPVIVFWIVPLGVVGALVAWWRPHWATWPFLALALCTDGFRNAVVTGNTDMWMAFAVAAGIAVAWPAMVAIIKPTFAPLALLALRRRSGWVALAIVMAAAIPFGSLWLDWFAVVRNGPGGLAYSLPNYSWVAAPALAWLARTRDPGRLGTWLSDRTDGSSPTGLQAPRAVD